MIIYGFIIFTAYSRLILYMRRQCQLDYMQEPRYLVVKFEKTLKLTFQEWKNWIIYTDQVCNCWFEKCWFKGTLMQI